MAVTLPVSGGVDLPSSGHSRLLIGGLDVKVTVVVVMLLSNRTACEFLQSSRTGTISLNSGRSYGVSNIKHKSIFIIIMK